MAKRKQVESRLIVKRDYKFDTSMKQAAERARAFAPKPISITSTVPEFVKLGTNK